ncbi:MAG: nucleotidyltransferase family protein [Armatimonadota bacterium]
MTLPIPINREEIVAFCRRHHIRKLALFGSILRDDFRPDSDVDVLVEFEPEHIPGLISLMQMQQEFSDLIGREADFRAPGDLHRAFRDTVVAEAEVLYAA